MTSASDDNFRHYQTTRRQPLIGRSGSRTIVQTLRRATLLILLTLPLLSAAAEGGAEVAQALHLKSFCDRQREQAKKDKCFAKFRDWCQAHHKPSLAGSCQQYWDGVNEVAKKASPAAIVPIQNATSTTTAPSRSAPVIQESNDSPPPVKKASKDQLDNLKGILDQAAEQIGKHIRKLSSLGDVFLNPAIVQRRQNAVANPTHTELTVNDPDQYYQGDVDLTEQQVNRLIQTLKSVSNLISGFARGRKRRKVGKPPNYERWPRPDINPIPYQFDASVPESTRVVIDKAIKLWETNTCVRFRKNGPGVDRLEFYDGPGCSSYVGKVGGLQQISLRTPGCDVVGIASHEIGHSLGFFHEQSRPDQEQHVTINYPNIVFWRYNNFVPQSWDDVDDFGEKYDFGSVMHYDSHTKGFTVNSNDYSIIAKDENYQTTMGQRRQPSFIDFKQVNMAYCKQKCQRKLGCTHGGYEDPNHCEKCKCPDGLGGNICNDPAPSSGGCGGLLTPTKDWQSVTSPNYPQNFPKDVVCNWVIRAPQGFKVYLEFDGPTFDFECRDTCVNSYVELKLSQDFDTTGYRLCCDDKPKYTYTSATEDVVLMLRGWGNTSRGFSARYRSDVPGGGTVPVQTVAPATQQPFAPVTPAPIPSTFAPVSGCDTACSPWPDWGICNDQCGGCGRQIRQRQCNKRDCHDREEKPCNLQACPNDPNGFQLTPGGRFTIMNHGCCLGLFNTNGVCKGLTDAISDQITRLFSGLG